MTDHTPGPWEANGKFVQLPELGYKTLAVVEYPFVPHFGTGDDLDANARLIAAAPRLLASLKEIMRIHTRPNDELSYAVKEARKAIEQATGEKPPEIVIHYVDEYGNPVLDPNPKPEEKS